MSDKYLSHIIFGPTHEPNKTNKRNGNVNPPISNGAIIDIRIVFVNKQVNKIRFNDFYNLFDFLKIQTEHTYYQIFSI